MSILFLVLSISLVVWLTAKVKMHAFIALLLVAIIFGLVSGMPFDQIISSINKGFGNTMAGIGLIIILGVIIGAFLENTGGAYALADKVLNLTGKRKTPLAMGLIGWIISIPVFADSGFMLMSPLNKSLAKKAGITLTATTIALAMGLMASHTLVPPTPGPIAAAHFLNANLGWVMLMGIPASLFGLTMVLIFIKIYVSKTYIDPNPKLNESDIELKLKTSPSASKSVLPIIVPIVLIVLKSALTLFKPITEDFEIIPFWYKTIVFLGEPFIALLIGCIFAILLPKKLDREIFSTTGWIGKALVSASTILLITGAGGIFGQVLRDSGVVKILGDSMSSMNMGLFMPFLLASAIKTAQGSSTVALITTASIVAPMLMSLGFESEIDKALVVLSIGAGSSVASHANDSFFWVVTGMSNMESKLGYKFHTMGSLILGVSVILFLAILRLLIN